MLEFSDQDLREMYLTSMTQKQCEKIHNAAMRVLEKTGVVFQSTEALDIFRKGGARVDGDRVYIPEAMIDKALASAPSSFKLYDQNGDFKFNISPRNCIYGPGSDCLSIIDHRTKERRQPVLQDVRELVTLCDALPNIDFLMSMVVPTDFPRSVADRAQMEIMLTHSTKPIIGVSFSHQGTYDIVEMCQIAAGGRQNLERRPFMIHYIQPVRPLVHNEDTLLKFMHSVKCGIPCVYLVSAVMGVTCPVTTAGYQAMGVAGELAALTLAQLIREGAPVVVRGGRVVVTDMKTMLATIADPGNRNFSTEMAHYHGLPSFGTAGCSDAKIPDWQAVAEASMTLTVEAAIGASIIHDVGYIESGMTYSGEMLVLCDEIISWIKAYKKGAPVNDDTLALDLIDELGIDGEFLTTEHTFRHYRMQWEANLFDRKNYEHWKEDGSVSTRDNVRKKIDMILSTHEPQIRQEAIQNQLATITAAAGKDATD